MTNKLLSVLSSDQILSLAQETGFVQRRSKFSPIDFVKLVLFDQLYGAIPSLEQHSFQLFQEGKISISKQGLHKRFNKASLDFVKKLFESCLGNQLNQVDLECSLGNSFRAVKVLDSTEFKLPDSFAGDFPGYAACNAAACAAIQFEYDVLSKKICCLQLGSARESDKTFADQRMDSIERGDLILRDLGYYSLKSYAKIEERGAFYISRLKAQAVIYTRDKNGVYTPISWDEIARRIRKGNMSCYDQWVFIGSQQKHPVRLLAWLLPADAQANRLRKKKAKKGNISKEDKAWSQLSVLVTNLNISQLDAQHVFNLYKIRWQVEWIFKTWKSHLQLARIRKMNTARLKCYLYAKFIWIMMCWDIASLLEQQLWKSRGHLVSQYKIMPLLKEAVMNLKNSLFQGRNNLNTYIRNLFKGLEKFCLKDSRKNKKCLKELLQVKPSICINSLILSHQNNKAISGQVETTTDGFIKKQVQK